MLKPQLLYCSHMTSGNVLHITCLSFLTCEMGIAVKINDLTCVKHLEQYPAHRKHYVNVSSYY